MLASVFEEPFDSSDYIFEVKWGGVRAIAHLDEGEVRLHGRNLRDLTPVYPELAALADGLHAEHAIVDGEIIAWGAERLPSPELLRPRLLRPDVAVSRPRRSPISYQVFDLLKLDGRWLLERPLSERRALLHERLASNRVVQVADFVSDDGIAFYEAAAAHQPFWAEHAGDYGPHVRERIEGGSAITRAENAAAISATPLADAAAWSRSANRAQRPGCRSPRRPIGSGGLSGR